MAAQKFFSYSASFDQVLIALTARGKVKIFRTICRIKKGEFFDLGKTLIEL